MDENRVEMLARQHGIRQKRDDGGVKKTLPPSSAVRMKARSPGCWSRPASCWPPRAANPAAVLKEAATAYKVDTDAIATKVKQEFAAKEKAKKAAQPAPKACQESSLALRLYRGTAAAVPRFVPKNRAGRTRAGFSLHPHPAHSGLRSPTARQESSSEPVTKLADRHSAGPGSVHADIIGTHTSVLEARACHFLALLRSAPGTLRATIYNSRPATAFTTSRT